MWVDEMRLKAVRIQFLNIKFHKGGTQMKREMAMLALSAAVALGCIGCGGNSGNDESKPAEAEDQTENSGKTDSNADDTTSEKPFAGQTVRVTS